MKTKKQDFDFEGALFLYPDRVGWLRANELYDIFEGMHPEDRSSINSTDLYFICKKPRLRIVEDSLFFKNNSLHIGFELSLKEGLKQQFLVINNYPLSEPLFHINQSNNSRVNHNQGTGTMPIEWLLYYLMDGINAQDPSLWFKQFEYKYVNNFEVLYIGKSFIKDGRSAFDRVKKHEKLQEIMSNILTNDPYNEVFVMFIEMSEAKVIFASKEKNYSQNVECTQLKELTHRANIPKEQLLSIAEACLIRYFEPEYNKNLKENFPSSDLKLLKECYDYDFSTIVTEIGTEYIRCNTYSKKISPSNRHIARFDLNNGEERPNIFRFSETLDTPK
jgi:hypothetical protein